MRKMCIVPKLVLEDCPGAEGRLELACHIAGQGELSGYPVRGLVARLLPNGDIRVKTPEEPMVWSTPVEEQEEQEEEQELVDGRGRGRGRWWYGFGVGVVCITIVWLIWEVVLYVAGAE